jgi:[ribosomal protein S5]-alanine N-acetyltransferase
MEIRTERLLLRRPASGDLDVMFDLMSNRAAMRFWSTLPHADRSVTEAWLAQMIARTAEGGEDFVMELDDRAIGFVGAGRLPEFGFMLHQAYWGQGFATEASRGFVDYAFGRLGASELTADVDPRNAPSLRVLGKLGFVVTGTAERTFLLGDEWCDSVYLRLDRPAA